MSDNKKTLPDNDLSTWPDLCCLKSPTSKSCQSLMSVVGRGPRLEFSQMDFFVFFTQPGGFSSDTPPLAVAEISTLPVVRASLVGLLFNRRRKRA